MMTLKYAHFTGTVDSPRPGETPAGPPHQFRREIVGWISDVRSCVVLFQGTLDDCVTVASEYVPSGASVAFTDTYTDGTSVSRTVLMVDCGDPAHQTMIVDRAWLLSTTGDTIERIAP